MTHTLYALLVGINDYLGGVNGLSGCVNDVKRMADFLQLRTQDGGFELKPLILTSGDRKNANEIRPTRQAVIDGFRNHLCQAGPDDVALFYYCGYGSQQKSPPEFWHLEPDRLDETIVCYDSRTDGSWDLADKELDLLVAEVAEKKPHIVVILDSCHSGSGTRAPGEPGVRLAQNDKRERPLDSFLALDQLQKHMAAPPLTTSPSDWLMLAGDKHVVLLYACRPEEVAVERFLGDDMHGVMSYYLLDTLQHAQTSLTYRDIFERVGTLVRNQVAQQNPGIEIYDVQLAQQLFLGGAVKPQPPYFSLTYSKAKGWVINGGAVNGIPAPSGGETTTLAVFGVAPDLTSESTMKDAVGWAKVTAVEPGESQVAFFLQRDELPKLKERFYTIVVSQPLPPILVWMQGDEVGLDLVRAALKIAGVDKGPSLIVQELAPEELKAAAARASRELLPELVRAQLTLIARDGRYLIRRSDDAYPLMVPVEQGYSQPAARLAVERLEHVARWLQVAQLHNKTSALPPDAVSMELYKVEDDGTFSERIGATGETVRLEYRQEDGKWVQPRFKLKLTNNSDRRLYCALLDLTETFGIYTAGLLKGGGVWLEPKGQTGSEVWTYQDRPIPASIPQQLLEQGVVSFRDILKLIASTTEVSPTLLERYELGVATRGTRSLETSSPKSSLARLYNRVQTRTLGDEAPPDETITDWTTSQVTIMTVHPRDSVYVPAAGKKVSLSDVVTIEGHPDLQAKARLTTFSEGTRVVGNLALPLVFRQHPELATPFQFSDYRGGAPGLSVIELHVESDTYKEVTPESPLVVHVARPFKPDDYVLPLAFDPEMELFLPLGLCERRKDSTTIRIERLPKPMSETGDLKGSIMLFFHKVAAENLGLGDGETSRLAIARVLEGRQVDYDASPVALSAKVAAAQRILLYIHGVMGNTRGMVASSKGLFYEVPDPPPVPADRYDLILAFDYDSINRPIEVTAIELKKRLAAVGLGAGHNKTLHIVALSMGCLVTRWFIEREAGYKVVQKAVLVGPPNAGTPWANLEDWAMVGLGAAINGLTAVNWPPAAIPALVGTLRSLVAGTEKVDITLDQLKPGSDFYTLLNASDDPKVPYAVIAGSTAKIHAAAPEIGLKELELLKRLADRLTSKETRSALATLAFFDKPNDTGISVESMVALPVGRTPAAIALEIPCDHMSYFTTEVGIRTISAAL